MNITPSAPGIRPGHYVNGERFALDKRSQAIAKATLLARTFGRPVYISTRTDVGGPFATTYTAGHPDGMASGLFAAL